ncbi:two-component system, OmpR family, response regulator MprA [Geoalkalibacter ferrihydriticus]|uniref:Two-component system, OmpR family, response regulator MprA n=1 Tax=Geoalkalibacter ferrihydriticus TaxID=392333 RepID=A0A1G9M5R7_9BACT|nr:response regulator [Geoalkalibacter ferrihydriticus]SDL69281.1 two-component system, OmpR family, response regulator MprA [Geoalkalibacter ferrihydriticus]
MKNILVVDDQASIRQIVKLTLDSEPFHFFEAESGEKALEIAQRENLDLIILDMVMPGGIDGLETLKALKGRQKTRDCPVLILTAKNQQATLDRALEIGASGYLTKPFKIEILRQDVRDLID